MTEYTTYVLLKEGLWKGGSTPGEAIELQGSRCCNCGEVAFPPREIGFCGNCQSQDIEPLPLSKKGIIYSYTVVMQRPPAYYQGPVPYAMGFVELPEGVRVQTLFTGCDFDHLAIGLEAELVLAVLHKEEKGDEVVTYMFQPILGGEEAGNA